MTSKNIQERPAAAAAVFVVAKAETANPLAARADPALKLTIDGPAQFGNLAGPRLKVCAVSDSPVVQQCY